MYECSEREREDWEQAVWSGMKSRASEEDLEQKALKSVVYERWKHGTKSRHPLRENSQFCVECEKSR